MAKEKEKQKEEKPIYTDEQFAERSAQMRPLIGQIVAYFDDGWRYGKLFIVSEDGKTAGIARIKSPYSKKETNDVFCNIMDTKPNDFAPALGGGFVLSPGGVKPSDDALRIPHNTAPASVVTADTTVEDLGIVTHVPATTPPVIVNGSLSLLDLVAAAKAQNEAAVIPRAYSPESIDVARNMPAPPRSGTINFDPARVVELFKQGMKVQDIACAMGYAKGQGNNRTKGVLKKAGLI